VGRVACAVTTNPDLKIDGIVLLTPWDTLPRTAQSHYWFLPALWLVRDRFDNIRNLKQFNGPVAVLMADKDKVIPNRLTQSLYRNILSPKRMWTFEGAGHNSWPFDPDLPWWIEVMDFVTGKPSTTEAESI
jgi:pimeloyl-ACP methyl ester carboxylesterase